MTIDMEQLVMSLGLIPRVTKATEDINCPLCGHKTLHFDFRQQVFACPVCAYGGGVIDAWAFFEESKVLTKKIPESKPRKIWRSFLETTQSPRNIKR
jgi:hypothetical protein